MNKISNRYTRVYFILLVANCFLYGLPANATEWWDSVQHSSGFTGFAPPTDFSEYNNKKQWRSGSSFNDANKVRYVPVTSKNPWKPASSLSYKKSFGSQRPWGNIPDNRPSNNNSMKFHDQRFKQWSHVMDKSYNNTIASSSYINNERSALPFMTNYGFPGSMYNSALITPAIYPGVYNAPGYRAPPYTTSFARPWGR